MSNRVNVVSAGVISAIGSSWEETLHALQQQQTGIAPVAILNSVHRDTLPVGEVKFTNEALAYRVGSDKTVTRTALLGLHAAKEAYLHAGIRNMKKWRVGLVSATSVGGMDRTEDFYPLFLQDLAAGRLRDVVNHEQGRTTELIADALEISDLITTVGTGGSSSLNALAYGARLIRHDRLDVVFAGGADALSRFHLNGFKNSGMLDKALCKPFDAACNGFNLGEGAAFVVMVSDQVLQYEEIQPLAVLSGSFGANYTDRSRVDGAFESMQQTLAQADLRPRDIHYLNLHGTGFPEQDLIEAAAVNRLFADAMPAVSSTKAYTGYTMGAAGAIGSVISLMSLKHQCVFPNLGFQKMIPEVGLVPQQDVESLPVEHAMVNAFSFNGDCAAVIFSRPHEQT